MTTVTHRPATPADHAHFTRFFAELGVPDPAPDAARYEADVMPHALFLEEGGAPVAYALVVRLHDTGYVRHVVVDPSRRGQGLGTRIMRVIADRLRAEGCLRWSLNVKVDNAPALRLYERLGFERAYRTSAMALAWSRVPSLPRESGAEARGVEPGDDDAIEAAFGLPRGRVAAQRQKQGEVLVQLVAGEAKVAFASFDPAFPGAFPFRAARPTLAAPLLDALRGHARPGDDHLKLTIEDDAPLAQALRDAGATTVFELFQMRGEVPAPGGGAP